MEKKEYSLELGGKKLTAIFTNLADQTNGSVMVKYGETIVLATAVMSASKREGIDFFPLVVDYEEKFYAAGKILGSQYIKREGRPSEEAILTGRIVDRTIRPFFDQQIRNEVQVVITALSIDEENDTDVPAVIAASLALGTSDIPWNGPLSAVRIGLGNGGDAFLINPPYQKRHELTLDLLVCGTEGRIAMIESEAKEVVEDKLASAFSYALTEIEKIEKFQRQIIAEIGKPKKLIEHEPAPIDMTALFDAEVAPLLDQAVFSGAGKAGIHDLEEKWLEIYKAKFPEANPGFAARHLEEKVNEIIHREAIERERRPDGRKLTELRPLYAEAGGLSPVVHGSGIFFRGGTHILSVLTLGGPRDALVQEGMEVSGEKYFMHHYNFPPFSTGETGRIGATNRRSIGHGALAEKSLRGVIPSRDIFPYTIRLVSEAFASNGSTSMGSVCASSLALMDGGVPIKAPVAGIAIGLMAEEDKLLAGDPEAKYKILTDIQGPEDHHGDMDFKVAGTAEGVTGIQLDIKVGGIPPRILVEALDRARAARLEILATITAAIAAPRPQIQPSAPMIVTIKIAVDKIGAVIGPGGKSIQKITADTGTEIAIEDDGSVFITGKHDGVTAAREIIEDIAREYKAGDKFIGEVTRLMDFGAFVKIGRDTEGLVHISELSSERVNKVTDVVKLGDKVPVLLKEIDDKGRINLSIKRADPDFAKSRGVAYNKPNGGESKSESGPSLA